MNEATLTIDQALKDATARLSFYNPGTAALDARLLLQHVLQYDWQELILNKNSALSQDETERWHDVIAQRILHKPVAMIIGHAEFYGASFQTTTDTLDPRPDSETVIDIIQRLFADHGNPIKILDLGTGTGCLLLTLLRLYPYAHGLGADLSEAALAVARENCVAHDLQNRTQFAQSDWFTAISGHFDLIVSNPPYIAHDVIEILTTDVRDYDPLAALDGGIDGLDAYRIIVNQAHDFLNPGGWLIVEIGYDQAEAVNALFTENGFANIHVYYDLSGQPRVVSGQRIT